MLGDPPVSTHLEFRGSPLVLKEKRGRKEASYKPIFQHETSTFDVKDSADMRGWRGWGGELFGVSRTEADAESAEAVNPLSSMERAPVPPPLREGSASLSTAPEAAATHRRTMVPQGQGAAHGDARTMVPLTALPARACRRRRPRRTRLARLAP